MIVITREELVGLGACDPGLAWFDEHVPSGRVEFPDLTALRVWASLREGADYVRWLLEEGDQSYRGAHLVGADLRGARLENARLEGANLTGVDLSCARLARADLAGAELAGADLTYADLADTNLSDAVRLPTDPPIHGWETYTDGTVTRLRRAT